MKHIVFALVVMLAFAPLALAGEECATTKPTADTPQMALFKVPGLTEELAKNVVKALADQPGILALKPNLKDSTLAVTFDGKKTTAESVQKTVTTVATNATLEKVGAAPPMAHGPCGGCPSRKNCERSKE